MEETRYHRFSCLEMALWLSLSIIYLDVSYTTAGKMATVSENKQVMKIVHFTEEKSVLRDPIPSDFIPNPSLSLKASSQVSQTVSN